MRAVRAASIIVLSVALLGCLAPAPGPTPAAAPPTAAPILPTATAAAPMPTSRPTATVTPPLAATPLPSPTFTLQPTARPQAAAEGPLTVDGQPLKAIDLGPGSIRYGSLAGGLVLSADGGRTWRRVSDLDLPLPLVGADKARQLFAGNMPSCYRDDASPRFYRSGDGGATWQELPAGRGIRPVAQNPGPSRLLYGISCAGLQTSADGGQTWQLSGPTRGWDITSITPVSPDGFRLLAVLTSEGGSSHLAWFDDQGRLVQDLNQGFSFWGRGALAYAPQTYYLADSTGVWRSADAIKWTQFRDGLADVTLAVNPLRDAIPQSVMDRGFGLFALAADPNNPDRLALGTIRGLYLSLDRGEHWQPAGLAPLAGRRINQILWLPDQPGALYATSPAGVFLVRLEG